MSGKYCIFSPDGSIPDIQIIFGGVKENDKVDANVTIIGKKEEILMGLSCIIHDLTERLGRDNVLPAVMIGLHNSNGIFTRGVESEDYNED